ncbi:MAG TPA: sulfite exporter TauE/SafE family protein [Candidatus Dorea intestinavium]|nr:sulfite exporter TauE/SafE family protein [Candidatus Dorea intestinavium]
MVTFLKVITILWCVIFAIYLYRDVFKHKEKVAPKHLVLYGLMGFVLNILDTLGVGSNATQMAFFKSTKLSPDDELPGNGNVLFAIPVAVEFVLFLDIVKVDYVTLIVMIVAAILGAVLGSKIVVKMPINTLRKALAVTLSVVAIILVARTRGLGPFGVEGSAVALTGGKLIIGVIGNFVLGALMTCGVGLYAPCMALCALLGMNITVAFPIMMGSCALLMPPASIEFIKKGKYNRKAALIAPLTGILGVLVAYFVVKSMPTKVLTYIVAVVLIFMSISFIRSIRNEKNK